MLDESTTSGVTPDASTGAGSDSVPASADTGGQEAINPTVQGMNGADPSPAQPVADNVTDADAGVEGFGISEEELAQAPEQWREKFKSLLGGYKSLEADHKPIKSWVEQRGGMEYVQADVQALDQLYSDNPEDRQQFYSNLFQDNAAFQRVLTDFATDPNVQREVLQYIDPQDLLGYVQQAGLLPEGAIQQVDPAVLAEIPRELQEVFRSLPPAVQDEYTLMNADVRNWNLRRDAQLYQGQQAERQRQQREQQQYQQQRAEAVHKQKSEVYNNVKSIIQQSLAEAFPGNDQATQFVLQATETALYQSEEGAALWNELEAHIDGGQARDVRQKLPLLIAKAKAMATKQAQWLSDTTSKARQFDELMRLSNYDDIIRHVNQLRGGMKQPGPGTTPTPQNGHAGPKPELAGQYDRANVLSYFPRS